VDFAVQYPLTYGGESMFSRLNYKAQRNIIILAFLAIPLALLAAFSYYPALNLFYLSFHKWDGFSLTKEFVGFENFITLFTKPEYFIVFKTSLYYLAGSFMQLALALYFATILNSKIRGRNIFKGIIFFPYLLNGVAIGFIFLFFSDLKELLTACLRFWVLEA
jgi:multiple sugar transport system permease protein